MIESFVQSSCQSYNRQVHRSNGHVGTYCSLSSCSTTIKLFSSMAIISIYTQVISVHRPL
jgi:hypothetical protein